MKLKKQHPLKVLIDGGEGQHLDFKLEISDAAKIARSLVAFANTDGGKLLIGVKDNGAIVGVRSEEEFYMIDNAAKRFCRPEVYFSSKEWMVEGKKILEIGIPKSPLVPHKAPDTKARFKAYIRKNDQNLLANGIMTKVWARQDSLDNIEITYGDTEREIMHQLDKHKSCEYDDLCACVSIGKHKFEDLMANFILMDIVEMHILEIKTLFQLKIHKED